MSVLATKLHLPSPRRRLVQRDRITDQLRLRGRSAAAGPGRGTGWFRQDHASGAVAGGGEIAAQGGVVWRSIQATPTSECF
jgi:hypothetical protein